MFKIKQLSKRLENNITSTFWSAKFLKVKILFEFQKAVFCYFLACYVKTVCSFACRKNSRELDFCNFLKIRITLRLREAAFSRILRYF